VSDHNFLTPRDESLADDLNKERGIVRGRVPASAGGSHPRARVNGPARLQPRGVRHRDQLLGHTLRIHAHDHRRTSWRGRGPQRRARRHR